MKSIISLFWFGAVFASPINVYHEATFKDVLIYRDLLVSEYKIPEELIVIRETKRCESLRGAGKLDLCLKNNGDLLLVSVDRSFVNESLKVFQAP